MGDVQNLATLIVDPNGKGLETHWQKTSQALLVGFILHAIYKLNHQGEPATLPNIDNMLVDTKTNIADLLIEMTQYPHRDEMGFRINITESIPIGLYRITSVNNLKNTFVIFCPDGRSAFKQGLERGYINPLCPGGYGYLMKKIVAIKGDVVSVTGEGVFVNGQFVPYSKPKLQNGMGRCHLVKIRLSRKVF